jgi:RNA polymerase sigma-70 factor (ECF subfamily)
MFRANAARLAIRESSEVSSLQGGRKLRCRFARHVRIVTAARHGRSVTFRRRPSYSLLGLVIAGFDSFSSMYPDCDLEMLMARYQRGDFAAATALIHRLSPQLHRFFVVQFTSRGHADDLVQETWLRIHEVRHTYRAGEPVLPWFYAIARHIRVDHYRKASRTAAREEPLEEMHASALSPPGSSRTPDLEALLACLPDSQREVIEMLKVAGMSLDEVARATSSSVGSVKQKAHRAYQRLRERLSAVDLSKGRTGELS